MNLGQPKRHEESHVTPWVFADYLDEQAIAAARPDENTFRFSIPGAADPLNGDQMIHHIDVVYQGDGKWSITTVLFRLPEKDSVGTSAIMRAVLGARGRELGS